MSPMESRELVTAVAHSLGLLDGTGELLRLDSLMVVDFALALEARIGQPIPAMSLTLEAFSSIDSVADLVAEMTGDRRTTPS